MSITREQILEALGTVIEPDIKQDIVSANLIQNLNIEGSKISLNVMVHNPAMHNKKRMEEAVEFALDRFVGKGKFELNCEVEGLPKERSPEQRTILKGVKHIVAVASGKGGVGKSTVTTNLAIGLAQRGYKVGLIDADIYGPSIPVMLDTQNARPTTIDIEGKNWIKPVENYGIKMLSIGFFAELNQAIVWRGPMASKALNQMFADTYWGELDYLLIDLPPGTGDIHLTLVQAAPLTGAVIVSTPQEVALADARKGVDMFNMDNINVPVLGIVENMSYFTPEELPDNKYYIFGKEGARQLAEEMNVPFFGEIPLVQSIREAGDVGRPAVLQEGTPTRKAFDELLDNFISGVELKTEAVPLEKF